MRNLNWILLKTMRTSSSAETWGAGENPSTCSVHLNASCHQNKFEVCGMSEFISQQTEKIQP